MIFVRLWVLFLILIWLIFGNFMVDRGILVLVKVYFNLDNDLVNIKLVFFILIKLLLIYYWMWFLRNLEGYKEWLM